MFCSSGGNFQNNRKSRSVQRVEVSPMFDTSTDTSTSAPKFELIFRANYGILPEAAQRSDFIISGRSGGIFMQLQASGEMYLETIYILSRSGAPVRSIDVSEYMGFSKPSVSRAVGILKKGGYLLMDNDGHLTLTDAGLEVAQKIYERHTMLTDFLIRLGVGNAAASEDACKMEHVISDETFEALKRHALRYSDK